VLISTIYSVLPAQPSKYWHKRQKVDLSFWPNTMILRQVGGVHS